MPRAVLDTTVLYAAAYRRDGAHERGLEIVQGVDSGSLPEAVVLDYVLAETLNGLVTHAGHDAAVDLLDRLEENPRFHVDSLNSSQRARAKSLFRQHSPLSYVDAAIAAYLQKSDLELLYSLDGDFDGVDGVTRLETAENPYEAE